MPYLLKTRFRDQDRWNDGDFFSKKRDAEKAEMQARILGGIRTHLITLSRGETEKLAETNDDAAQYLENIE